MADGVIVSMSSCFFVTVASDSSSVSEKRRPPAVSAVVAVSSVDSRRSEARERPSPATLRRNPGLLKDLRPALEHALADRLEDLGVRPVRSTPERSDFHMFYYRQSNIFSMQDL